MKKPRVQLKLRLEPELHKRLSRNAKRNCRSLNTEICECLQSLLGTETIYEKRETKKGLQELRERYEVLANDPPRGNEDVGVFASKLMLIANMNLDLARLLTENAPHP